MQASQVPPPPEEPRDLLAWAEAHQVSDRLDDLLIGNGADAGRHLVGRWGDQEVSYREVLIEASVGRRSRHDDLRETARRLLHRIATLADNLQRHQAWMRQHGRDPEDPSLAAFLQRLQQGLTEVSARIAGVEQRPAGTYEPVQVVVAQDPVPMLRYQEWTLTGPRGADGVNVPEIALMLLGWNEGPLQWRRYRMHGPPDDQVQPAQQHSALEAMIDLLRDPGKTEEQEALAELLRLPAWQYALGSLDERLSLLQADQGQKPGGPAGPEQRVAFRVSVHASGHLAVEPIVQKRVGGGYSKGSKLEWYHLPDRPGLTDADRRVYRAYDDRFARRSGSWGGPLTSPQVFGILRALIDHPAVFLEGERDGARLDIRQGRLRLRFIDGPGGSLAPQFDLLGLTLLPADVAGALRDARHLMFLHRPDHAGPQVLLAQLSPQAAAVVQALALAPGRFPPEAHDALAARLEALQETVDIEFPSQWTRTIAPADGRMIARLELLASGAVQLRLCVRPVKLGPVFPPGEGPALVLEGQGRERHGARRDRQAERQAGHALAERLNLGGGEEIEPWCWRVSEGDPALHMVATLHEMTVGGAELLVEWADDGRLLSLGSVGRRNMRMKVADQRDWFAVEGGAEVKGEVVRAVGAAGGHSRAAPVCPGGDARVCADRGQPARGAGPGRGGHLRAQGGHPGVHGGQRPAGRPGGEGGPDRSQHRVPGVAPAHAGGGRSGTGAVAGAARAPAPLPAGGGGLAGPPGALGGGGDPGRRDGAGEDHPDPGGAGPPGGSRAGPGGGANLGGGQLDGRGRALRPRDEVAALPGIVTGGWPEGAWPRRSGGDQLRHRRAGRRRAGPHPFQFAGAGRGPGGEKRYHRTGQGSAGPGGGVAGGAERNADRKSPGRAVEPAAGDLAGLLGSWEEFRARYAVPIEKFGDDRRRSALVGVLRPFVLRRTKAEVAPELPARTEIVRKVNLSAEEQGLYEQLRQSILDEIEATKSNPDRDGQDLRFVLLGALTRMRQLCCHPRLVYPRTSAGSAKAAYLLDLLEQLREGGHRALVFSQFRSFLELLEPRLRQHGFRVLVLDGTTPAEVREQRIAAFQQGQTDVFLISLKAGGFGLNLTAADTVIHLDPWWNPAVEDQATARAHRIGQSRPVTAVRLVASDTVEEAVLGLHAAKRALAAGILEGSDVAATLDTDQLLQLIRQLPEP